MTSLNGLLIFLWKETHSETKSRKSSRILRVNPNLFFFLKKKNLFLHFFHFFIFQYFQYFQYFHFISFCFSFSIIIFLFLFVGSNSGFFFWASTSPRILFAFFQKKNSIFRSVSGCTPLRPLFLFFPFLFFPPFSFSFLFLGSCSSFFPFF